MFDGKDVANVVGGRGSRIVAAERNEDSPRASVKTADAALPLKRYIPHRELADGTIEILGGMGGSARFIAPDPVERAMHRANVANLLPPVINRPPPSTEHGQDLVDNMKGIVLQKILDNENNALKREAQDRLKQGLEVDEDDRVWTAAAFPSWSAAQCRRLREDMERRRVEGKQLEAERKRKREVREAEREAKRVAAAEAAKAAAEKKAAAEAARKAGAEKKAAAEAAKAAAEAARKRTAQLEAAEFQRMKPTGVSKQKSGNFSVCIDIKGSKGFCVIQIGTYATVMEAARAFDLAWLSVPGRKADERPNFPHDPPPTDKELEAMRAKVETKAAKHAKKRAA